MEKYIINGGKPINGSIKINGSKNSALPILTATILNKKENIIKGCPKISDIENTIKILKKLGCKIIYDENNLIIDSKNVDSIYVSHSDVIKMRSSILFLGSLLGRFKEVKIGYPGGCNIGKRPIDIHLKAMKKMGVEIYENENYIHCFANNIKCANINFDYPSVGATENIIILASTVNGTTIINNAAKEPEIIDLASYINKCGGKISGAGTDKIIIEGKENFDSVSHTILNDRIEAGTYLCAAAITGGKICIENLEITTIRRVIECFKEMGCTYYEKYGKIYMKSPKKINYVKKITTEPFPGFPTDMQPQIMSVLTLSKGTSIIIEKVFESRFKHIHQLQKMGADISCDGQKAIIKGVDKLYGNEVFSYDLRGGASLIIAGLAAMDKTVVYDLGYIKRGYENIEKRLEALGADIKFEES